jgi:hypothetical protein
MSNARCLTEGVDVPAVDMVAFLAPRRSRVDIVQAVGRAMWTAPGKTTGYVFLPLYVQEAVGESVEDAVDRTEFDEVWNVLQALQEQDEVLADIIREVREAQGRTGGFDDSRLRDKVQILGPAVSLDMLRAAITTRCIERLAAFWDYMFGKLAAFKERFGHCNVTVGNDPQLGSWVEVQRGLRRRGLLLTERGRRLDALGFEWDPRVALWEEVFARLVQFKQRLGHCNVPKDCVEDPQLGIWVDVQRQSRKRGRLSAERHHRLDALGFEWDPRVALWEEMFTRLVQFHERFGHCNVPANWPEDQQLAHWVTGQRQLRNRGRLPAERRQRLDALPFEWDPYAAHSEEMFARLVQFKERAGHCNVPQKWPEDQQLAHWVTGQRQLRNRGRLPAERRQRLDALGFDWDPVTTIWEKMCDRLAQYRNRFGHCDVPREWPEDQQLASWVTGQRQLGKRGRLPTERRQRLEALGFTWDPISRWQEKMFAGLVHFKGRFGHCNVPRKWPEDRQLANWVGVQRNLRNRGRLPAERRERLDALGFTWDPLSARLEEMFARLVRFKERFGHCNVPNKWEEDTELAHWVGNQRQLKKRNSLSSDRIRRLDALGFEWDPKNAAWEEMFSRLVEYQKHAGNCRVPQQWPEDQHLANWVGTQRQRKKYGHLSPDQIQRLDALGFEWNARTALWEEIFDRLVRYKARFHDCNIPIDWEEDPQLARWVFTQRRSNRLGQLSFDRRQRLDALGFEWDPHASDWEEMFDRLVRYKERAGDCNVPQQWPEDQQLARWVHKQRQLSQHGQLSLDRHQRLDALGFEWDPKGAAWEEMFKRLVAFMNREGHCLVRRHYAEDPSLAYWVNRQRDSKRHGQLSADRIRRLDDLGFEWDPKRAAWEEIFNRLVRYKDRTGDCNVPRNWPEDRQLSNWVHTQRRFKQRDQLSAARVQRLDMLGFEWEPKRVLRKAAR